MAASGRALTMWRLCAGSGMLLAARAVPVRRLHAASKDSAPAEVLRGKRMAVLGAGKMAEAIISGLLDSGAAQTSQLIATDKNEEKINRMREEYKIEVSMENDAVARDVDVVLAAVKPQHLDGVLAEIKDSIKPSTLFISIVAGVKMSHMQAALGIPKIIRTMPNTPACIGKSMTVWTCQPDLPDQDRKLTQSILRSFGDEIYVSEELSVDMATALSGTGPAYYFMVMEAMIDAGVHIGFPREVARQLVLKTMEGSVALALHSGKHPAYLRNDITSPGGTSAAALYEAEKGNLRTVITNSVWAAYRRSLELGGADPRVGPGQYKTQAPAQADLQALLQAALKSSKK